MLAFLIENERAGIKCMDVCRPMRGRSPTLKFDMQGRISDRKGGVTKQFDSMKGTRVMVTKEQETGRFFHNANNIMSMTFVLPLPQILVLLSLYMMLNIIKP